MMNTNIPGIVKSADVRAELAPKLRATYRRTMEDSRQLGEWLKEYKEACIQSGDDMNTNIPGIVRDVEDMTTIAKQIIAEHEAYEAATRKGLEQFRDVGEMLIRAKKQCRHGEWLPWLKANVQFSLQTASNYMRLAEEWDKCNVELNLEEGLRLLTEDAPEEQEPPSQTKEIQGDDGTLKHSSDNSSYLVRRLKLKAPKYAKALACGKYKSARAACVAAGIVRLTAIEQIQVDYNFLDKDEQERFRAWINEKSDTA